MVHEHVNIHILLLSLLWDCVHRLGKCLVNRGECVYYRWFVQATHLCVAHLIAQKSLHLFFGVVRLGDVLDEGGGGGGWSMFQEVGDCMGFQRGAGWVI